MTPRNSPERENRVKSPTLEAIFGQQPKMSEANLVRLEAMLEKYGDDPEVNPHLDRIRGIREDYLASLEPREQLKAEIEIGNVVNDSVPDWIRADAELMANARRETFEDVAGGQENIVFA